jgi:hypothetical protein
MQHSVRQRAGAKSRVEPWLWLGMLLYVLVMGMYFVGRFGGLWAEADSATFANVIRAVLDEGRLAPQRGEIYPNGYAFQAISVFLVGLTGLDVATLQQAGYPLLASLIVLPAWLLYRELTGSARGATITTALLFIQPEFLFVTLRSSHEKFTRVLLLLCLYWLVRSFKLRDRPGLFAAHVALFYLTAYAFIASNNLHANSFIFAIVVALCAGRLLARRSPHITIRNRHVLERLVYATVISIGLVYLFTFYLYPPAQHDLLILRTVWERVAALFLDVQTQRTNAYDYVSGAWVSLPVYFMVSIANWLILGASFVIWARQGVRWVWKRESPPTQTAWLLWLLYGAFAAQGAISVVSDASGVLGSNLQHRLFPSFSMIAVAVVGLELTRWRPRRFVVPLQLGFALGVGCIAVLSAFKASNEPILSNKWTFYQAAELSAIDWSDAHLRNETIWAEFDERMNAAYRMARGESPGGNLFVGDWKRAVARNMLLSDITRLRSSRLRRPLPVPADALRVYDNGTAELYHVRPLTPYQK